MKKHVLFVSLLSGLLLSSGCTYENIPSSKGAVGNEAFELVVSPFQLDRTKIAKELSLDEGFEDPEYPGSTIFINDDKMLIVNEDNHFYFLKRNTCGEEKLVKSEKEYREQADQLMTIFPFGNDVTYESLFKQRRVADTMFGLFFPFGPNATTIGYTYRYGQYIDGIRVHGSQIEVEYGESGICKFDGFWLSVEERQSVGAISKPPVKATSSNARLVYVPKNLDLEQQISLYGPYGGVTKFNQLNFEDTKTITLVPVWLIDYVYYDAVTGERLGEVGLEFR
ncbi:hypothetical protein DS745_23175 [Anaerobacillus alkaliphilus]|uniref:Uncharacterized protein n=1 Tax=Anaerobacillus alkaliphilus TaxID=1548597 RepID=A0A4Q0VQG7_9BACI|nr:hypothetical protein [Anaerobacillus alkaliphilus]RXI96605.1 hypothetical protein DS745_23175 [Anaerobacillus alkaliphilus]